MGLKLKKTVFMIMVIAAAILFYQSVSAAIWGGPASEDDLTGNRTSDTGGGVYSTESWDTGGFSIDWVIVKTQDDHWLYTYEINTPDKYISHFLLEVTEDSAFTVYNTESGPDEAPRNYSESKLNPLMPNSMYGIKFGYGGSTVTYVLETDRAPVYGVFYAKNGKKNQDLMVSWSNALNYSDYKTNEALSINDFIVRPDSEPNTPVNTPVPPTIILFASGFLFLTGIRRKI